MRSKKKHLSSNNRLRKIIPIATFVLYFIFISPIHAENIENKSIQQDRVVTGVVLDVKGEPIVGATITEKENSNNGTITNQDGEFSLEIGPNKRVQINYLGYFTQEIETKEKSFFTITLLEETKALDEIVVVGYGTQKKINLTGSVSALDLTKELESRPITNISTGLAGLSPGLYVRSASNDPGSNATLMLRGQGTLNNSSPLIIVDGVESKLNTISPQDVATLSILKDAASASIYGSRGANGVILITTKQGKAGKLKLEYNGYAAYQSITKLMPLVENSVEYMEMINEAAINSNISPPFSQSNIDLWRANQGGDPLLWPNTNWGKALFRTALTNNHNLSVSGGTENMRSHLSYDYANTPGIIENTGFQRHIVRSNNQFQITPKLLLGANISGFFSEKEKGSAGLSSMFTNSVGAVPTVVTISPDGRYGGTNNVEDNQQLASPLWYVNALKGDYTAHQFTSKFSLSFQPFNGLNINASYYYEFGTTKATSIPTQNDRWNFQTNTIIASGKRMLTVTKNEARNVKNFMDADISYERKFLNHLNIRIMVGGSQEQLFSETMNVTRRELINEHLTELNAANGTSTSSGDRSEWAMQSFFSRLNINWKERYLLEVNFRRDGSSRFSPQNRWGNFPSISAGWRLSEEKLFSALRDSWLNDLKLRASYGSLGNNAIGNYVHVPVLTRTNYAFNDMPILGFYLSKIPNLDVSWESTYATNIGLDFTFLQGKVTGSLDLYNKLTKDVLIGLPAPFAHGAASIPPINSAQVKNQGLEITLGWQSRHQDFNYYIKGNLSYNKNEVVKFKGDEYQLSGTKMIKEGLPINIQYIRKVDRIIQTEADQKVVQQMIDNAPTLPNGTKVNPFPYGKPQLGDFLYKDLNNDGIINDDDREIYGHGPNPQFMFGLSLGCNYKGFDLSALMQGVSGLEEHFRNTYYTPVLRQSIIVNKEIVDGRWYEGRATPATYPRIMISDNRNIRESDFWVQDKSYLKIRNLQLGYTLPSGSLSSLNISRLRIYASLENFFTFTKWKGLDPEVEGVNYPTMKQLVFGVNLSF